MSTGCQFTDADRQRLKLAVHEAGHAVVGLLYGATVGRAAPTDDGTDGECTFTADCFGPSARAQLPLIAAAGAVAAAVFHHGPHPLAGLVSRGTDTNLTDAVSGEQHEADVMYPDYTRQAEQAANPQAASLLREIAGDEKTHQQAFQDTITAS